ncbi:hypothetical protein BT96DRAFT_998185 [Gymnopus androsaceus JB14]|uniref:Uncharacterized protein n=1 Tax=Gymnopus androsaceus JB14 TaxID=1447944 RepID=A0A6A4HBZ6_9AGAR|nr:hypothetical protein BT96DRAFT_998185 [Gymnopus androsaceus JB14]
MRSAYELYAWSMVPPGYSRVPSIGFVLSLRLRASRILQIHSLVLAMGSVSAKDGQGQENERDLNFGVTVAYSLVLTYEEYEIFAKYRAPKEYSSPECKGDAAYALDWTPSHSFLALMLTKRQLTLTFSRLTLTSCTVILII